MFEGFIEYLESSYNIERTSGGKQLKLNGQCPFCGEDRRDMRMYVNSETGLGQCFHCGEPFGPYKFIMALEGCSFDKAVKIAGGKKEGWNKESIQHESEECWLVWPHKTSIDENKIASEYLIDRGISHKLVKHFGLYFSEHQTKIGGKIFHTENRIVIPIHDINGVPISWQARSINGSIPKYLFPPSFKGSQTLFNAWTIPHKPKYLIVCEGVMDVFGWWRHGASNVVATFGKKISDQQMDIIKIIDPEMILIAWDTDAMMAKFQFCEKYGEKYNIKIVDLSWKDSDECDSKELVMAINSAKSYSWEDKIKFALNQIDE